MHAAFGSPAISTFLRALRKGYLSTIPRLTSALFCKYKPNPEATAMGHLDRHRQGLDSTSILPVASPTSVSVDSPMPTLPVASPTSVSVDSPITYEDDINALSDSPAAMDTDSTIYVKIFHTADFDLAARFPIPSAGYKYIYQLVSCYKGNIHVETMPSRTSGSYILAYEKTFQHWSRYGPVPSIVRLDNETSAELEKFLLVDLKVTSFLCL